MPLTEVPVECSTKRSPGRPSGRPRPSRRGRRDRSTSPSAEIRVFGAHASPCTSTGSSIGGRGPSEAGSASDPGFRRPWHRGRRRSPRNAPARSPVSDRTDRLRSPGPPRVADGAATRQGHGDEPLSIVVRAERDVAAGPDDDASSTGAGRARARGRSPERRGFHLTNVVVEAERQSAATRCASANSIARPDGDVPRPTSANGVVPESVEVGEL